MNDNKTIKRVFENGMEIQEVDTLSLPFVAYHTHGIRQQLGTSKLHSRPDCPVLKRWKPLVYGHEMAKVIMKETFEKIEDWQKCKFCW